MSAPTPTRRTQAERTRASREKIIQAATEYFAQLGYHGTSMAEIARSANLTEPGLLHHFSRKTDLLTAVLAERDKQDHARFSFALHHAGNLLTANMHLVEYNQTVPGLVQLFTFLVAESIPEEHPGHDYFLNRYRNGRARVIEALQEGQQKGQIRDDISAEDLGILIYAMMDGLQVQWLYEPDKINMARVFGIFNEMLKKR